MKRRLEQIINGKFEYEPPALILSRDQIRETVKPGNNLQGEISLGASDNRKIRGYLISDNRRILVNMDHFSGNGVTFVYGVDTAGLQPGEQVEGKLYLTTSIGEASIPVSVAVAREQIQTCVGEITSMEEFANLAKTDFREAFRLFCHPQAFGPVFSTLTDKERAMYLGMAKNPVTYQHLEEFLVGMGYKERVGVRLKEERIEYYEIKESIQEFAAVQKKGWGHLYLEVETDGGFLEVTKKTITEEDFIGSLYHLNFVILKDKLGKGKNLGRIRLKGPYEELVFQVAASTTKKIPGGAVQADKRSRVRLMQDYLRLRAHKLDYKTWLSGTREILGKLKDSGQDYPEYQVYEAYVEYQEENPKGALDILKKYQDKTFTKEDLEFAGIYVYLCCRLGVFRDKDQVVQRLHNFYHQKEDSFLLFWAWTSLDEEMKSNPSQLAFAMEELFDKGCCSPLLYLEAWNLISKNENLLRRVSGLWTQVFLFAGKEQLLTEELSMRLAYLSGYEKTFSRSLYRALAYGYEAYPSDDTLEAVCKYIMKGNPVDRQYFRWFSLAVERGLRLTRLYEYYMETLDTSHQRVLPRTLLLYFAYNNSSLSDTRRAFLFANIIANRDKEPQIYESYKESMEEFAAEKLSQEKINEDYAVIYQELCLNPKTLEEGSDVARMLFACRLYCDDPKIRTVIVRHSQIAQEEVYPCIHGVAYPRIYTRDAMILFQDDRQIRYASTVDYNLKKLLDEKDAAGKCLELGVAQPGLLLHACREHPVCEENLELYQVLAGLEDFTEDFRRQIRQELLEYYGAHLEQEAVEDSLRTMKYQPFAQVDKKKLLELLIDGGLYQQAYSLIRDVGCEGVSMEKLLMLVSRLIIQREFEEDEELLYLTGYVYQGGKFDEVLLTYRMKYVNGPVDDLVRLWDSARSFRLDTYQLEERILETLMYTWDYRIKGGEIFQNYVRQTGKEKVIMAYLTFVSYGYFVHGHEMPAYMEICLKTACLRQWQLDLVCRLALLQLYAGRKDLTENQEELVKEILGECVQKKLAFGFFRKLPAKLLALYQMEDKTFVEYRADPRAKVVLHYRLDTGFDTETEFQSEPVRSVYEGIFLKTFTLFYGETLQYYFTEEYMGNKKKSDLRTFTMNRTDRGQGSKYEQLNRILSSWKLTRGPQAARLLQEYLRQEQYVKRIFTIEKEL